MIRCVSQLRTGSGAGLIRSLRLNCASSHPSILLPLSKQLPFAGNAVLEIHRYFGKLNDKKDDVIDRSKFTHEVKIYMPDVGEGEDVKGVIETWYKKKGDLIKKDDMFTFGLCTDDDFDSIMGDILVPENAEPVAAGTVICTTFNEGHGDELKEDDDKDDEFDNDNSDGGGSKKGGN
eukprot:CCRYP_020367-RB/>CCRYP_020367-RB protein AED:0.37 eAED:0.37 QI:150/0.88/0.8/1/0.11/0.1/10/1838/176